MKLSMDLALRIKEFWSAIIFIFNPWKTRISFLDIPTGINMIMS